MIIYNKLNEIKKNIVSFHMPGHKNGRLYDKLGYKKIIDKLFYLDTTEIYETDNLHNPDGIILDSQKKSVEGILPGYSDYDMRYLINGSTSGIISSIMAVCKPGEKIIINRGCHKSAYNACVLGDVYPIFVEESVDFQYGIILGSYVDKYIEIIDKNPDAKGIYITRPTYYGMCFEIEYLVKYAQSKGMRVIVDEAHGSHLFLSDNLPDSALKYGADLVIQSFHKTLPSITQSSVIFIKKSNIKDFEELLINDNNVHKNTSDIKYEFKEDRKYTDNRNNNFDILSIIETSSPSYIMMMSIEIAVDICKNYGRILMNELLNNIKVFKEELPFYNFYDISDSTKIFINTMDIGLNGEDFSKLLRYKYNIQVELSNIYGILMLCTIGNEKKDFDRMRDALIDIYNEIKVNESIEFTIIDENTKTKKINSIKKNKENCEVLEILSNVPDRVIDVRTAFNMNKKYILLDESKGKVCGDFITPYPPGISILAPGELITEDVIDYINKLTSFGMYVSGVKEVDKGKSPSVKFIKVLY